MEYPIHPACAQWPRPSDSAVAEMAASIKIKGLLDTIWLTREGEILDGKTRYEACGIAGVEPRFETYTGPLTPEEFSITKNAERRHMEPGPLSLIVAALHNVLHGGNRGNQHTGGKVSADTLPDQNKTLDRLADAAGLGRNTVAKAKSLLAYGEPNIIKMVRNKEVGVINAALYAKNTPREEQRLATAKAVKTNGAALRTPNQRTALVAADPRNITSANYTRRPSTSNPPLPAEKLARVRAMPEKMVSIHVLIEELAPLFGQVLTQAKVHQARVSQGALAMIAGEGQRLLDSWASDDPTVRRLRGHVVPFKQSVRRMSNVSSLESA